MLRLLKDNVEYVTVTALSAALFYLFFGFKILNPFYIDWILAGGDPTQHYLGWALYRYAPFRLQIGLMNTAAYPFDTSIIFTDSIPLMSVPCKFIGLITDRQFQFFGIWGLLCLVLMAILSCFLLSKFINNKVSLVLASMLLTASPCMLRRVFWHSSLAAHFLIIIGLILIAYRNELCRTWQLATAWWAFLAFLCSFVHLYFLAMDAILLLGFVLFVITDRRENHLRGDSPSPKGLILLRDASLPVLGYLLAAIISIWLLGGFASGMSSGAPGLGYYSFNLNGFFDPDGWSCILNPLPRYADGQYEGFAYLGLGVILALAVLLIACVIRLIRKIHRKESFEKIKKLLPYCICVLIITLINILMAASNEISFGSALIFQFDVPEMIRKVWDIFRASGRLIWPAVYIIALIPLVFLPRIIKGKLLTVVLVICVLIQIGEMREMIVSKHTEFTRNAVYENRIDDPKILDMFSRHRIKHIVFLDKDNLSQEDLYAFTELATRYRLTVNDFYFARYMDYPTTEMAYHDVLYSDYDTIFVISDKSYDLAYMFPLEYREYHGLLIGTR